MVELGIRAHLLDPAPCRRGARAGHSGRAGQNAYLYGEGPVVMMAAITKFRTFSASNDFILEALTPLDVIVYESPRAPQTPPNAPDS